MDDDGRVVAISRIVDRSVAVGIYAQAWKEKVVADLHIATQIVESNRVHIGDVVNRVVFDQDVIVRRLSSGSIGLVKHDSRGGAHAMHVVAPDDHIAASKRDDALMGINYRIRVRLVPVGPSDVIVGDLTSNVAAQVLNATACRSDDVVT